MIKKTLFYIELPPPVHGMTYLNEIIYESFKEKEGCAFYITDYSQSLNDIEQRSLVKIILNLKIILYSWFAFLKNRPDQVYIPLSASRFGILRDLFILLPALVSFKKIFLHLHGFTYFDIYKNSSLYRIILKILCLDTIFISLCEKQKEKVEQEFAARSIVVRNTIKTMLIEEEKVLGEKLKLLYIGNISDDKGVFDLIESLKNHNDVELIIAGDIRSRHDKDIFEEKVTQNNHFVQYVGFANEDMKKKLLKESHIFCMPSKLSEGSPISIIEALSCGLPVIATDRGCVGDMIADAGYLIQGHLTENEMQKALDILSSNYSSYTKKSRKIFNEKYAKDNFLNEFCKITGFSNTIL